MRGRAAVVFGTCVTLFGLSSTPTMAVSQDSSQVVEGRKLAIKRLPWVLLQEFGLDTANGYFKTHDEKPEIEAGNCSSAADQIRCNMTLSARDAKSCQVTAVTAGATVFMTLFTAGVQRTVTTVVTCVNRESRFTIRKGHAELRSIVRSTRRVEYSKMIGQDLSETAPADWSANEGPWRNLYETSLTRTPSLLRDSAVARQVAAQLLRDSIVDPSDNPSDALYAIHFWLTKHDLNGDGVPELFVQVSNDCGSGGCTTFVYQTKHDGMTKILEGTELKPIRSRHLGFSDLVSDEQAGVGHVYSKLLEFDGRRYRSVRCTQSDDGRAKIVPCEQESR